MVGGEGVGKHREGRRGELERGRLSRDKRGKGWRGDLDLGRASTGLDSGDRYEAPCRREGSTAATSPSPQGRHWSWWTPRPSRHGIAEMESCFFALNILQHTSPRPAGSPHSGSVSRALGLTFGSSSIPICGSPSSGPHRGHHGQLLLFPAQRCPDLVDQIRRVASARELTSRSPTWPSISLRTKWDSHKGLSVLM
jgi:hypothetical protein